MDQVNATPEFAFPLQLVWRSTNKRSGLFGPGWYCPQLESSLLPGKDQALLWQSPSGRMIALHERKGAPGFYESGMEWMAKTQGSKVRIWNAEGWSYLYRNAILQQVQSPTHRILKFEYRSDQLSKVTLSDEASNHFRVLVNLDLQKRRAVSITTANGRRTFAYYKKNPEMLAEYRFPGIQTPEKYSYDKTFRVLERVDFVNGLAESFQQGEKSRLRADGVFKYTYKKTSGGGMAVEAEDAAGGKVSVTLEPQRGMLTRITGGSKTVTYFFRAPGQRYDGRLRRIERDGSVLVDHVYDPKSGRLSETRDASGEITFYEYPLLPRNADSTHPLYDKPVRVFRGTRESRKEVAAFAYDAAGRVTEAADTDGQKTAFAYSLRGELSAVTPPTGRKIEMTHDPLGHILSVGEGIRQQKTTYDELTGKVKYRQLPDGQYVDYRYDDCGRVTEIQQNRVPVATIAYDPLGRVAARRDGLKRETRFGYDPHGNILEQIQPNGTATRYEYDARNLRTAQIDGKGNRITFAYDENRRLIEQVNPLGQKLTWTYDQRGRLTERSNGAQVIQYGFDDKHRLRVINYGKPGEKIVHSYDDKGRLSRAATPTLAVTLTYDALNRVVARTLARGDAERVLRYTYNAANRKTSVVLSEKTPDGTYRLLHQTAYGYDEAGNLSELKANSRLICKYAYDSVGRLSRREYGNGIIAASTYDSFGRLLRVDIQGGCLVEPMILAYAWDAAGQVTARTWNGETQNFTYDGAGQLLTAEAVSSDRASDSSTLQRVSFSPAPAPQPVESYRYDAAGNIVEKFERGLTTTMTYDAANQLVSATRSHPASTASPGNSLTVPPGPRSLKYFYDAAGRQIRIEGPNGTTDRHYGWLDKVIRLKKPDGTVLGFDYYPDGQIAAKGPLETNESAPAASGQMSAEKAPAQQKSSFDFLRKLIGLKAEVAAELDDSLVASAEQRALQPAEEYVWDDLALLWKNGTGYAVEPHPSGGTCVAAFHDPGGTPAYFLNDILGTTLAVIHPDRIEVVPMTAFGKPLKKPAPAAQEEALPSPQTNLSPEAQPQEIAGNNKLNTP
mgnify:CR=1 FL=1